MAPGKVVIGVQHAFEIGALRDDAQIFVHGQHFGGACPEDSL